MQTVMFEIGCIVRLDFRDLTTSDLTAKRSWLGIIFNVPILYIQYKLGQVRAACDLEIPS